VEIWSSSTPEGFATADASSDVSTKTLPEHDPDRPVVLRFYLRDADLFAWELATGGLP